MNLMLDLTTIIYQSCQIRKFMKNSFPWSQPELNYGKVTIPPFKVSVTDPRRLLGMRDHPGSISFIFI